MKNDNDSAGRSRGTSPTAALRALESILIYLMRGPEESADDSDSVRLILQGLDALPSAGPIAGRDNKYLVYAITVLVEELPVDAARKPEIVERFEDAQRRLSPPEG